MQTSINRISLQNPFTRRFATRTQWFTIVYLPFSLVFLSHYLTSIARTYIVFHVKNIKRLEKELRQQLEDDLFLDDLAGGELDGSEHGRSNSITVLRRKSSSRSLSMNDEEDDIENTNNNTSSR